MPNNKDADNSHWLTTFYSSTQPTFIGILLSSKFLRVGFRSSTQPTTTTESSGSIPQIMTSAKTLTETEIEALVAAMRGADGVEIKDRRYRGNVYPQCFIGAEAVEWLAQRIQGSRPEAISIGQMLIERGIIHHVIDDYPFQDDYSFYRFYRDDC